MTDHNDQAEAQARREYIRTTFGDDALEGLATDQPKGNRTAQVLAQPSLRAAAERQHAQDVDLVMVAANEQAEDEALAQAVAKMRRGGGRLPAGTMRKAAKALERRGYHQGTTAERLARMAGQGAGWRSA
jgi:hypothetical protein